MARPGGPTAAGRDAPRGRAAAVGADGSPPLIRRGDLEALEALSVDSRDALLSALGGQRQGVGSGSGFEFVDYRRYTPGDDVRRIDWNVYARLHELHVRVAPADTRLALSLLLDASASMDFGNPNKLYYGRRLAALLGAVALIESDTVRLHTLSDGGAFTGTLLDSRVMLGLLLEQLERLPAGRTTRLANSIRRARDQRPDAEMAVLISDALVPADDLTAGLRELSHFSSQATLVHLIDPAEASAGPSGSVQLVDRETGQSLDIVIDEQVGERYAERHARFLADVERACRTAAVGYVPASTSVDPLELLLNAARSGLLLRAGVS
jgi:uncharacterized protein (DUF58 family)